MNARWLSRPCPKCRGVLAVIVPHEHPLFQAVNGRCIRCGYRMLWAVIWTNKKYPRTVADTDTCSRFSKSASRWSCQHDSGDAR